MAWQKVGIKTHTSGLGTSPLAPEAEGQKPSRKRSGLLWDRHTASQVPVSSRNMAMHRRTLPHRRQAKNQACCTQMDTQTQRHTRPFISKKNIEGKYLFLPPALPSATCPAFPASSPHAFSFFCPGCRISSAHPPWHLCQLSCHLLRSGLPASQPRMFLLAPCCLLASWHTRRSVDGMAPCFLLRRETSLPGFFSWLPPEPPAVPALALWEIGREETQGRRVFSATDHSHAFLEDGEEMEPGCTGSPAAWSECQDWGASGAAAGLAATFREKGNLLRIFLLVPKREGRETVHRFHTPGFQWEGPLPALLWNQGLPSAWPSWVVEVARALPPLLGTSAKCLPLGSHFTDGKKRGGGMAPGTAAGP